MFLVVFGAGFVTVGGDFWGGADVFVTVVSVACLRVGVGALDAGLLAGKDGLLVGVEDLALDLGVGVEDLAGRVDLVEPTVVRGVGVEDLEGLDAVVAVGLDVVLEVVLGTEFDVGLDDVPNVGLPVGVAGLEPGPPEEDGLRSPELEVFNPGDDTGCLDTKLFLPVASGWVFDSRDFNAVGRALGVPV